MASERQIAANRRNAKKSTGPKSKAGKARSRRNAVQHGALARTVIGEDEDLPAFRALHRDLIDHYRPCTRMEEMLVERLAMAFWRDRRVATLEREFVHDIQPKRRIRSVSAAGIKYYTPSNKETEQILSLGRYSFMITREIQRLMAMLEKEQAQARTLIDVTPTERAITER